ncbi:MAG: hypothetical protein Q8O89_03690 [Nanoarchaeota archaeon]|nr:hypothetical protein [Nanoarchaeota archaeon]
MKQIFTISIDEELVQKVRDKARTEKRFFRNKSHLVEEAIREFLEGKK